MWCVVCDVSGACGVIDVRFVMCDVVWCVCDLVCVLSGFLRVVFGVGLVFGGVTFAVWGCVVIGAWCVCSV